MKVLYMGTPDFAVLPLKTLLDAGHEIVGVITREDKPKGRGMKVVYTPVKEYALSVGLPVFQPTSLKDEAILPLLDELSPDIIIVVAYGKILPKYILDYPKYGCINLHGSLLPKYRGSAPIQRAVLNGDSVSGVTTMLMNEGMDTGDILLMRETEITSEDTSESLFDRLSVIGAELLSETVTHIEKGDITPRPQDESLATYAPPIRKEDAKIEWNAPACEILNLVRGSFSWPIAYSDSEIGRIKVYKAKPGNSKGNPGEVLGISDDGLEVACGDYSVYITLFRVESGKQMTPAEYFRGHPEITGTYLS